MNNKFNALFVCLIVCFTLVSCNQSATTSTADAKGSQLNYDFSLTEKDVDAYLSYKNIDPSDAHKRDRAIRSLIVRNALAEKILQQEWANQAQALSHIKDRRNQILINNYFEDYVNSQVNAKSLQDYYDKNKLLFADKSLKLAVILKNKPQALEKKQKVLAELAELAKNLKSGGGDFAAAAKSHSDDKKTAAAGGDMGWKAEADVERIVFNTAVRMTKGAIAGPLETKDGFVLIKLLEDPAIQEKEFESVKAKVERQFRYSLKLQETARLNQMVDGRVSEDQAKFKIATR